MAFVKLYKVVQDSPLSYQYANQLADNQDDLRTQLFVAHGENEFIQNKKGAPPTFDFHTLGRHDLEEIPRSCGYAALFLQSSSATGTATNIALQLSGPGIPSIYKYADGCYVLPVVGLSTWWAKCSVTGGTGTTYLEPQVRPFYPSSANGNNAGLRIYTYKLDSGAFVLADASFSIDLYGTLP